VDISLPASQSELVSDTLWAMGVVAIEEIQVDNDTVTLRTSMGENPTDDIALLVHQFPFVSISSVDIARTVADTWRAHAEPTWVTEDVVFVPTWLPAPPALHQIFIEPLDTFGLGNHPTTVAAMQLALQHVVPATHVLDLGSGSGILGIALSKILGCRGSAFDIASGARNVLKENCKSNHVENVAWTNSYETDTYDAVIANILAPVLRELAGVIQDVTQTNGVIILSGMRDDQVEDVLACFDSCFEVGKASIDGWTAVALQKVS
jgi:ribosomal protein L11 methyltransferase